MDHMQSGKAILEKRRDAGAREADRMLDMGFIDDIATSSTTCRKSTRR